MNIRLGNHPDCAHAAECESLAADLHRTLSTGRYDWPASILPLDDFDGYLMAHRTARKRRSRAARFGYRFEPIDRADHIDAIHAVNTSMPKRQGRPMTAGYLERPTFAPLPAYECFRHRIDCYGVFASTLVAYIVVYTCGQVALVSQILGHADHLANDVMYLLAVEAFRTTVDRSGPVVAFYNRHDSGTDGLVYFKERLGFRPARLTWLL